MLDTLDAMKNTPHEQAINPVQSSERKELAYAFFLGDVLCRIGADFKSENENTAKISGVQSKVCCITTDVNITPQMLKKAFDAAVEDTLQPLYTGVDTSPNDFACILSSCKAGNYIISAVDSEYKKFADALKRTLAEIAANMAEGNGGRRLFCNVQETKSKRTAQRLANAIISSRAIRAQVFLGKVHTESLLCALCSLDETLALDTMQVYFRSEKGNICVWDYGKQTDVSQGLQETVLLAKDVYIDVRLHTGNYKATAIARLCKELFTDTRIEKVLYFLLIKSVSTVDKRARM
jgi:glutamate N-acetyltransferase/amino-acid N-acetyltransferase